MEGTYIMDTSNLRQSGRVILLGAIPTGLVGMALETLRIRPAAVTFLTILTGVVAVQVLEADRKSGLAQVGLKTSLAITEWLERVALSLESNLLHLNLGGTIRLRIGEEFYLPRDGVAYLSSIEYLSTADDKEAWFHFSLRSVQKTIIMPEARVREEGIRSILSAELVPRLLAKGARTSVLDRYFSREFRRHLKIVRKGAPSLEVVPHDPEAIVAALAAHQHLTALGDLYPRMDRRYQEDERFEALFAVFAEELAHALQVPVQEASLRLRDAIELLSSGLRD